MRTAITVAKKICDLALDEGAENAEGFARKEVEYVTRIGSSQIIQTANEKKHISQVRVHLKGGIGTAMVNSFKEEDLKKMVNYAIFSSKANKDPHFTGFPKGPFKYPPPKDFKGDEKQGDPELRAEKISQAISSCHQYSPLIYDVAGNLISKDVDLALSNTEGIEVEDRLGGSSLFLCVTARNYTGESKASIGRGGWGGISGELGLNRADKLEDLDTILIAQRTSKLAVEGLNARHVKPDRYDVIFTPTALSIILGRLATALSSDIVLQRLSFLIDKIGEKVASEDLTVFRKPSLRFDGEGLPAEDVVFIDKGKLVTFAYDTLTAAIFGVESNGCAGRFLRVGSGFPTGYSRVVYTSAEPLNVKEGSYSLDELLKSVDKGILVTHISYVSNLDGPQGIFTGMTRNGTFFIEGGELAYPIKNMRLTDKLSNIMLNTVTISDGKEGSPSIKVKDVTFTGVTEY